MTHVGAVMIVVAMTVAGTCMVAAPAAAANKQRRHAYPETGPLIVSGGFAPATRRRAREPDICKPVIIKRRPIRSTLLR